MKRIGALLLSLCMILTAVTVLISCGDGDTTTTSPKTTTTTPKVTTTLPKLTTTTGGNSDDDVDENVILIGTKDELFAALTAPGESYAGKTLKLTDDIVLNDTSAAEWYKGSNLVEWPSMALFAGTFDGNGHSITGVYLNYGTMNCREEMEATKANGNKNLFYGMFEQTSNATFKNLALIDAYAYVNLSLDTPEGKTPILKNGTEWRAHHFGLLSACTTSGTAITIDNCYVDAKLELINVINAGVLSGWHNGNGTISNCITTGEMTCAAGGAIINGGGGTFKNCFSTVKVNHEYDEALADAAVAGTGLKWVEKSNLFGNISSAKVSGCFGILGQFNALDSETQKPYLHPAKPENLTNSGYYAASAFIGEAAKTIMSTDDSTAPFDWENVWQTNANGLPSLRLFPTLVPTVPAA